MQEPLSPEEEVRRTLQFLVEENLRLHQIVASIESKSGVALATASVASETLNKIVTPAGIGPQQFRPLPSSLKLQPLTPFEGERGSNEDVDTWLFKAASMFALCGIEVVKQQLQQPHTLAATLELVERLENVTIQSGFRPMFGSSNTTNYSAPTPMDLGAMQNSPRPYRAPRQASLMASLLTDLLAPAADPMVVMVVEDTSIPTSPLRMKDSGAKLRIFACFN
ncbi:hypothetical protein CEUSTIGMA_g7429.t1 [Chlamydomonas eustigma]|uniref:Uncharacterized protein n=1 Tax=Chlamydomonas eustigma TaxID=1157962 RepID=A0A250XAS8_9CHLO|nr:hypothetical protein CEUSTIGMA_g7429.t1 [Chlamydomonas eustigma]|eukprot:GAX79989.1 hypothetical protein CEUSTIGMA_g7429.t1 [Chlamydomonas eustigma]